MMYVWYSKTSCKTGKALSALLGCEGGVKVPKKRHTIVVCYGAVPKTVTPRCLRGKRVLNNAFQVRVFTDKFRALCVLRDQGVVTPAFSLDPSTLEGKVIRRTNKHHGGNGFVLYDSNANLSVCNGHHYLQYVDNTAEYRVHIFNGEVIKISRKKPLHENAIQSCRSHANGWYFSKCDINRVHDQIKQQAILAVKALNYDFGAVDIIYNKGGNAYVLEVNSGMGLDNSGLALYVDCIKQWSNMQEVNG